MSDRDKVAHLLRRFGFGACKWELDFYVRLGVQGAIERLLNYEQIEEGFPVDPWRACFEEGSDQIYLDPFRVSGWWSLRMLMSQRPLEQKLTLFWHDHFAVGADKVEFGPMMLSYIETLRAHSSGKFANLLKSVCKQPAMVRYLDAESSFKGNPNENFARELLELFTIGIGNYTETDVDEAARCFTGWGNRYILFEGGGDKVQAKARECIAQGIPMVTFSFSPELHDHEPKTVVGQTKRFSGDELLEMLASRAETAKHICRKLWEFFAYENPSQQVVDRLVARYSATEGDIKATLREITLTDEFWSEKCVRQRVKSPAEFVVGVIRALNVQAILLAVANSSRQAMTPLPKPLRDTAGLLAGSMFKQGMLPLFPPNVGGWEWGTAWISTANMAERMNFANLIMGVGQPQQPLAAFLGQQLLQRAPSSVEECSRFLAETFDSSDLPPQKLQVLTKSLRSHGLAALKDQKSASDALAPTLRLLFGSPEFQFC